MESFLHLQLLQSWPFWFVLNLHNPNLKHPKEELT
jgi:hypothetical protein